MSTLVSESYVFDPRPLYPYPVSVKRYTVPGLEPSDPDAVSLVFCHATSFHNEIWEPVIEDIYGIVGNAKTFMKTPVRIREAWAIECPNHGESAVINEDALLKRKSSEFSWDEYATIIHLVLTGQGKGIDVDFRTRKLVGVGHSMGAVSIVLTHAHKPSINWSSVFLLEPMFVRSDLVAASGGFLSTGAQKRRDVWPSREAAHQLFLDKSFKSWDPRVVERYVKYGLRDLPTAYYPGKEGVTLKCTKIQEAATYNNSDASAFSILPHFCAEIPAHVAFGAVADIVPEENQDYITNDLAQGKFKTVALVDGAGHLAMHHNPLGVAELLWGALAQFGNPARSKL
ncbi:alpha/beta-hydrolase [Auriscalpium vulgare]|uniref:Alpha/beta-hydrolase n=1 Tax=Auriscalpium vulgare TaxID=40419 RepID=A0ACB8S5S1_9AGAM|nr:alpha/beta-hydrolase [Auriscalpium vulgare]